MSSFKPYIKIGNSTWKEIGAFEYRGTNVVTLSRLAITVARSGNDGTARFRLYDKTNNNQIAIINFTSKNKTSYSTTSFTNLPSSSAVIEIQAKITGGDDDDDCAHIYSMILT